MWRKGRPSEANRENLKWLFLDIFVLFKGISAFIGEDSRGWTGNVRGREPKGIMYVCGARAVTAKPNWCPILEMLLAFSIFHFKCGTTLHAAMGNEPML